MHILQDALLPVYTLLSKETNAILMSGYLLFTSFCERRFYFNMAVHIWNSSETSHKTINVWKRQNLLKLICIMCTVIFRIARNLEPAGYVQKSLLKCIILPPQNLHISDLNENTAQDKLRPITPVDETSVPCI